MRGYLGGLFWVGVLASGSALAQILPFEGRWTSKPGSCQDSQGGPGGPVVISANRLVAAPFMRCEFKSVLPGGASYRVEASCDADGQKGEEFFTFAVLAERLYWSWGGQTGTFERCPAAAPN